MPDIQVKWPSENEEFDATTTLSNQFNSQFALAGAVVGGAETEAVSGTLASFDDVSGGDAASSEEPSPSSAPEPTSQPAAPEGSGPSKPGSGFSKPNLPKPSNTHAVIICGLVVIALLLGVWAFSLNSSNSKLKADNTNLKNQVAQLNANPQAIIQKQTDELIAKVGKLMQLPTGETPTVANVTDAAAAKKQSAFFTNAQNGDKVLMYVNAKEAILYRPSTNKIVLVAPLSFNSGATASSTSTTKK